MCIFSGGGGGALCRLQLAMPLAPGATPSDIQVRPLDRPWAHLVVQQHDDTSSWQRCGGAPFGDRNAAAALTCSCGSVVHDLR